MKSHTIILTLVLIVILVYTTTTTTASITDSVKNLATDLTGASSIVDDAMDKVKHVKDAVVDKTQVFKHDHGLGDDSTAKFADLKHVTETGGKYMTSNTGTRVSDDQNSLKAGVRGPTLMEDHFFREKMTHFDHERIPERVVHARGVGFHGYFQVYEDLSDLTKAAMFRDPSKKTPVFVRFSTVIGSRGSPDTPRDVRGFATKFYTSEGVWDLVGNNIPVFFIQDSIKFPDLIHAAKPEPHTEVPQAQTAHDTFWDFVSLMPESAHMLMWTMSDRAFPISFDCMEGFGVHTFRFVNEAGKSRFVKFHWKPVDKGVHSFVWAETQQLMGRDPDYNRRRLWEAIENGVYPEWELGIQVVEEEDEHKFDFDLLDATKIIPEELVPVRRIGKMTLNRNVDNFFSETEQVAFHPAHIVPGIDFTNDPLLQGRLFSYIDTQILRVGPNFAELPINRAINEVHNNNRDGKAKYIINKGKVSYFPNSLGKGCPMHSPEAVEAFSSYMEKMEGRKVRERSPSFKDHFSQATLFWNSMADWEKQHIVDGFSFELNMVNDDGVRSRLVNDILVNIDEELAKRVSNNTGIKIMEASKTKNHGKSSPALSMNKPSKVIKGRKIAILAGPGASGAAIEAMKTAITAEGAVVEVINRHAGYFTSKEGTSLNVNRAAPNAPSVIYDAVFIPDGDHVADLIKQGIAKHFVTETFIHFKPIAAVGAGAKLLDAVGIPHDAKKGVFVAADTKSVTQQFIDGMKQHRFFNRDTETYAAI